MSDDRELSPSCVETIQWRNWYLDKYFVQDPLARSNFLYLPCLDFVKRSPEENLIEAFSAALPIKR